MRNNTMDGSSTASIGKVVALLAVALLCSGLGIVPANAQTGGVDWVFLTQYAIGMVIFGLLYILPSIMAFKRSHPNRWLILVINIVFGGTGIGWLGSLVWAFSAAHLSPTVSNGGESGLNLFVNDSRNVVLMPDTANVDAQPSLQSANKGDQSQSPTTGADTIAQLEKLAALKNSGTIDEAEFARIKARLLR